jgi:hypothetical protein
LVELQIDAMICDAADLGKLAQGLAAVASDERTAAQLTEGEVLHTPKITLTQQRYHGGLSILAGDVAWAPVPMVRDSALDCSERQTTAESRDDPEARSIKSSLPILRPSSATRWKERRAGMWIKSRACSM